MNDKPFWENSYGNNNVSTFKKGPTQDINDFYTIDEKIDSKNLQN